MGEHRDDASLDEDDEVRRLWRELRHADPDTADEALSILRALTERATARAAGSRMARGRIFGVRIGTPYA